MFGLKDNLKKMGLFELEELCENPTQKKNILKSVEEKTHILKKLLREGTDEKSFQTYGTLLHGYLSFKQVVDRQEANN